MPTTRTSRSDERKLLRLGAVPRIRMTSSSGCTATSPHMTGETRGVVTVVAQRVAADGAGSAGQLRARPGAEIPRSRYSNLLLFASFPRPHGS